MNALSLALLYGILWINSVHGSEDNNVRRLSKDIPEQDFADPQGGNTVLSAQDHESSHSQSQSFLKRNRRDIITAFCVTVVVPMSIAAIVCAAVGKKEAAGAAGGVAFVGIFFFLFAYTTIITKDEMVKQGLTPSWRDVLNDYLSREG